MALTHLEIGKQVKQLSLEKEALIVENIKLRKALEKALNIYGRGYEPKEGVEDTIGSKLFQEIKDLIN